MRRIAIATVLVAAAGAGLVLSQESSGWHKLSDHEVEQLVVPFALYPDSLLDTVLEASKDPQDLVKAGDYSFHSRDPKRKIDPKWPQAVRDLLAHPRLLWNLDRTLSLITRLGNAYTHQATDVRKAIQSVRKQIQDAGNLVSNEVQTVTVEANKIHIRPTDPDALYIPYYHPYEVLKPANDHTIAIHYERDEVKSAQPQKAHPPTHTSYHGRFPYPEGVRHYPAPHRGGPLGTVTKSTPYAPYQRQMQLPNTRAGEPVESYKYVHPFTSPWAYEHNIHPVQRGSIHPYPTTEEVHGGGDD